MSSILALRNWLRGIRPEELNALLIRREEAHGLESLRFSGGPAEARLRKAAGARIWVTKAPQNLLVDLAVCGAGMTRARLEQLGFTQEEIADPDLGTLERMMAAVPAPWAALALFGMALGERFPVRPMVLENWERLWSAGRSSAPEPDSSERAEILADHHGAQDGTDGEPGPADADGPTAGADDDFADAPDLTRVERETIALREQGERFAEHLEACAASVRAGSGHLVAATGERAAEWLAQRDSLASLIGRLDAAADHWRPEDPYEVMEELLADVRNRQRESAERAAKLEALDARRATYAHMLEEAVTDGERGHLRSMIDGLAEEMDALRGRVAPEPAGVPEQEEEEEEPSRIPFPRLPEEQAADDPGEEPSPEPEAEAEPGQPDSEASGPDAEAVRPDAGSAGPAAVGVAVPAHHRPETPSSPGKQAPDAASAVPAAPADDEVKAAGAPSSPVSVWAGPRPPVQRLIEQGRLAEAYWLTLAAKEPKHRAHVLAFANAAFHSPNEQGQVFELQIAAEDQEFPESSADREAYLIALGASLRTGLVAGWPLRIVTEFVSLQGLPTAWARLLDELVGTVKQSIRVSPGEVLRTSAGSTSTLRQKIGAQAAQLGTELPQRTIKLARGTQVLQALTRDGALARTLRLVQDWAEGQATPEELAAEMEQNYRRSDAADRLINAADRQIRTPRQAKQDIHSSARDQLRQHIKSVVDLLREAMAAADSASNYQNRGPGSELHRAVTAARQASPLPGPGGATLSLLLQWLCGRGNLEARPAGLSPSSDCLLGVEGLAWRQEEGTSAPDWNQVDVPALVAALEASRPAGEAVESHLRRGDVHLARRLLAVVQNGELHGVLVPEAAQFNHLRRTVDDSAAEWHGRLATRLEVAASLLAQIRAQNLLSPERERVLSGRLLDLGRADTERYGADIAAVEAVIEDLQALVDEKTRQLASDLAGLTLEPASNERISTLLESGDTVTAEELLSFARQGNRLPDWQGEPGTELDRFLAGVNHPDAPTAGQPEGSAAWWATHYSQGQPLVDSVMPSLEAWEALRDPHSRRGAFQKHVPVVLRLLGLQTAGKVTLEEEGPRKDWSVLRLHVRAEISESLPGYLAGLGSRARGSYKVLVISDEQRGDGPLRHLPDSALGANIILYLQPLGAEGRRRLADRSRNRPQQALVVDPAVIGWIAAREPRSFRATQRVTLPWTGWNPYTPYEAGLVPPEIFKGRDEEKSALMGRDGSLFLYGGRQLGKSSLLRQVADIFQRDNSSDHVAVYIDLLKADIGHAERPERIWTALLAELKRQNVIGDKVSDHAAPEDIADHIRQWLGVVPTRRMLVLADEADAFLNSDARTVYTEGGQSNFRTVKRLQRLMDDTDRGFKVVFAGLHQVQRFNHLTNVVTAHGGPGIQVGPLKPNAAVELVSEPLAAVGLVFETPDLVWRILAITNYQANLVQIFCSELVKEMMARALAPDGHRPRITARDVQTVAASSEVRQRIAERLRFTLNLEDRYRVLALLIALSSLREGYARGYSPQELLEMASEVWPEGFPLHSVNQVRIDLEEMEGLGLLIQLRDDRTFAMRSPNVVNMLGTYEELDAELRATEFTLPYDYNPRSARRSLRGDGHGIQRMSPLTEEQLREMLAARTAVVSASPNLGAALVERAVQMFVDGQRVKLLRYDKEDDVSRALSGHSRLRHHHLLLVDMRGKAEAVVRRTAAELARYTAGTSRDRAGENGSEAAGGTRRQAVVISDPMPASVVQGIDAVLVRPERWTVMSLRAWPESPFSSPEERRALFEATGGWPAMVERVIDAVRQRGETHDSALAPFHRDLLPEGFPQGHFDRCGLDSDAVETLVEWAEYYSEEERRDGQALLTPQDLADVLEAGLEEAEKLLERLDTLGVLDELPAGVTLDPVTFRSLKAVAAKGRP
ncbi:ATP-binding protein [Streptomyces sp. NPDC006670]|uniref:ATP-binding protein n=1 Tax=Streptomyces sp. NPDC006670 TaxID=3154476 RepID=UPI0033D202D9